MSEDRMSDFAKSLPLAALGLALRPWQIEILRAVERREMAVMLTPRRQGSASMRSLADAFHAYIDAQERAAEVRSVVASQRRRRGR